MKLFSKIFLVLLLCAVFILILLKFYNYQQIFNLQSKSFISALNDLQQINNNLKYDILQNSVFAYNNQDRIAQDVKLLEQDYEHLQNEPILDHKNYNKINANILMLASTIDKKIDNVNKFLIINAGIKNSFVFLSQEAPKSHLYFKSDDTVHEQIALMMSNFSNTRSIQDSDYLNKDARILSNQINLSSKQKEYLQRFNLHAIYLINNFPNFLNTINIILNTDLQENIALINNEFSKTYQNDMQIFHYFSLFVLISLLLSAAIIISLFIHIARENRALIKIKSELDTTH